MICLIYYCFYWWKQCCGDLSLRPGFICRFIYTFLSVQDDQFADISLLFRKVSWCSPVSLAPSHLVVSCVAVLKKALNAVLLSFKMVDFDGWRRKLIFIYFIYLIKHGHMFFCMLNNANNGPPLSMKRSEVLLTDRDQKLRG